MKSVLTDTPLSALPQPKLWALGEPTVLRLEDLKRPEGYSLDGEHTHAMTLSAGGFEATGYGEGIGDLAEKRAYSEAIERLALLEYCNRTGSTESSNGWAAHLTADQAVEAAIFELIERDVALATWESGGVFHLVPEFLWPAAIQTWKSSRQRRYEFHDLKIFLSANSNGASISALLFNERGNFVSGHGSARTMEKAILSATHECLRAAHSALRFAHFHETKLLHGKGNSEYPFEPGAHSLAYAYSETMPSEVRVDLISGQDALSLWRRHQLSYEELSLSDFAIDLTRAGSRIVARVKNSKYRKIFWGPCQDDSKPNKRPHFVG